MILRNQSKHSSSSASNASQHMVWVQAGLLFITLLLTAVGFVMIYSASQVSILSDAAALGTLETADPAQNLIDQLKFFAGSIVILLLIWLIVPVEALHLKGFTFFVWCVAIILLGSTALFGTSALGAQRWLVLGPISIQPSEFIKIALLIVAAAIVFWVINGELDVRQTIVFSLVGVVLPMGFLYFSQSDLGTTMIIFIGCIAVMWLGGVPTKFIVLMLVAAVAAGCFAVFGTSYRQDRLVVYDPWNDGEGGAGSGYQYIHSFYAFSRGGILGAGLGNSREKFDYLPEAETDFVFSIIGEEAGLIGATIIIVLFVAILVLGILIARTAPSSFSAMVAGGCAVMLVFQAFLNIACVIGLFPTTGKPLPFISSGGSSLVASYIMVGLMLSVARQASASVDHERRRADLRVVRSTTSSSSNRNRSRNENSSRSNRNRRAAGSRRY